MRVIDLSRYRQDDQLRRQSEGSRIKWRTSKEMRDRTQASLEAQRINNLYLDVACYGTGVLKVTEKSFRLVRMKDYLKQRDAAGGNQGKADQE